MESCERSGANTRKKSWMRRGKDTLALLVAVGEGRWIETEERETVARRRRRRRRQLCFELVWTAEQAAKLFFTSVSIEYYVRTQWLILRRTESWWMIFNFFYTLLICTCYNHEHSLFLSWKYLFFPQTQLARSSCVSVFTDFKSLLLITVLNETFISNNSYFLLS